MSKNRETRCPAALLNLSKATLADIVWELAAVAPGCASCDDFAEIWRVIGEAALQVKAPRADVRAVEQARERVRGGIETIKRECGQ